MGSLRQPAAYSLHAGHLTDARFYQSQCPTVVTHVSTICYQFTDPGGMDGLVDRARPGNRTMQGPPDSRCKKSGGARPYPPGHEKSKRRDSRQNVYVKVTYSAAFSVTFTIKFNLFETSQFKLKFSIYFSL